MDGEDHETLLTYFTYFTLVLLTAPKKDLNKKESHTILT